MILLLFPILLLVTAIGSVLWYQHTANDIFGVLAAASAIACLVWGLVIAHWSIHLLSLIVLLKVRAPIMSLVQVNNNLK